MIEDHSHNNQSADSQGKLVLPAASLDHHAFDAHEGTLPMQQLPNARQSHQKSGSSSNPFAQLGGYWRSSPAHQFLIIVVCFATVVGFIFAGLVGLTLAQPDMLQTHQIRAISFNQASPSTHTGSVTVTPSHGPSNTTSETPTATPTPSPIPEPTTEPTPQVAPLTLQITSAPTDMDNDTSVDITVQTSQPSVPVHLVLSYSKATGTQSSKTHQTDANGMVTFHLHVSVVPADDNADTVKAQVVAVGEDQNQQVSQSQGAGLVIHIN